ncbi:helix-turn-helix domain-containing protein, partial [Limnobacter sp.]|uniref:helix-turn-helix domain-containing protein n=1 Tax=Limnobacter sp. TaxID=2003368 RepID=UPI0027328753
LENVCRWITVMAPAQLVEARDLPPELKAFQTGVLPVAEQAPATPAASNLWLAETGPTMPAGVPYVGGSGMSAGKYPFESSAPETVTNAQVPLGSASWLELLFLEAEKALESGKPDVMDALTAQFETTMIQAALKATHGKRIEAAQRLGIGRNTITRKIQDLNIDVKDID